MSGYKRERNLKILHKLIELTQKNELKWGRELLDPKDARIPDLITKHCDCTIILSRSGEEVELTIVRPNNKIGVIMSYGYQLDLRSLYDCVTDNISGLSELLEKFWED